MAAGSGRRAGEWDWEWDGSEEATVMEEVNGDGSEEEGIRIPRERIAKEPWPRGPTGRKEEMIAGLGGRECERSRQK